MKIFLILILIFFICGCNTEEFFFLKDFMLDPNEIEGDIVSVKDFIYSSSGYYSDYPSLKHIKGFQESLIRRFYFTDSFSTNFLHINLVVFDSLEHAKEYYEYQISLDKSFFNFENIDIGDEAVISENKIYFVKNNYFVEVRRMLSDEMFISFDELIDTAEDMEKKLYT